MPDEDRLLTRHEAARAAGVSFQTILLWIRAGRLHPESEPGPSRPVIRRSDLTTAVGQEHRLSRDRAKSVWDA